MQPVIIIEDNKWIFGTCKQDIKRQLLFHKNKEAVWHLLAIIEDCEHLKFPWIVILMFLSKSALHCQIYPNGRNQIWGSKRKRWKGYYWYSKSILPLSHIGVCLIYYKIYPYVKGKKYTLGLPNKFLRWKTYILPLKRIKLGSF